MRLHRLLVIGLLSVAVGCQDSSDPDPVADAGPDATVSPMDASTDAALDAGRDASADATTDAALDAGCTVDFPSCTITRTVAVECEGATCSGDTPICLRRHGTPPTAACGAADAGPPPDAGLASLTDYYSDACDDSADCPEGTRCFDGFNKGLNHNNGARCESPEPRYCGGSWQIPSAFAWQRCSQDCECPTGQRCADGKCAL